ncbi:MAG: class I SAM-dependent methyltransferase [Mariprofundaceae bacterium]|nr:class I SAM-dependent methyltransferase [Mariprofundaceae bacterium]
MTLSLFETCPLQCTSPLEKTSIVLPEGALYECPSCGQLLSSCTQGWYNESMQEFDNPQGTVPQGSMDKRYDQRMSRILKGAQKKLPYHANRITSLDVGCSSGALLQVAQRCGFNAHGVEPADQAANTASGIPDVSVFKGFLHDAKYPDNHFDMITLFEVIEHLTDPISMTQEISRILKPGGIFLIGTGNADSWTVKLLGEKWEYFDIAGHGGHISFFTPKSMRKLADHCQLNIKEISTKRVNFGEKKNVGFMFYQFNRIVRELLALPARWTSKGHDMLVTMQKSTH